MTLNPPPEYAHEQLLRQFEVYVAVITTIPRIQSERYQVGLDDNDTDPASLTYRSILTQLPNDGDDLLNVHNLINSRIASVNDYLKVWTQYQALWDMQPDAIHTILGENMQSWLDMLNEIKRARATFDTSESSKNFGPISVNYAQVQSKVNLKYDALHTDLLSKFGVKLGAASTRPFVRLATNSRVTASRLPRLLKL